MDTHVYDVFLPVLLYEENGEWNAHALEMDVVGSGPTPEKAESELKDAIFSQISFAAQMNNVDLISHPAPKEYFNRWKEAQQFMLAGLLEKSPDVCKKVRSIFIRIPRKEVQEAVKRSSFVSEPANA